MKNFFAKHKALAKLLKIIGWGIAGVAISYVINTIFRGGASADFVKLFTIGSLGGAGLLGLITEIIDLCKGLANKHQVNVARDEKDRIKEEIELGNTKVKDPINKNKETTVPELGSKITNLTVELNNSQNDVRTIKGNAKTAGETIVNIINTNEVLNNLLSKNVSLQENENKFKALKAKLEVGADINGLSKEILTLFEVATKHFEEQRQDNIEIGNVARNVVSEGIKLTK